MLCLHRLHRKRLRNFNSIHNWYYCSFCIMYMLIVHTIKNTVRLHTSITKHLWICYGCHILIIKSIFDGDVKIFLQPEISNCFWKWVKVNLMCRMNKLDDYIVVFVFVRLCTASFLSSIHRKYDLHRNRMTDSTDHHTKTFYSYCVGLII